MVWKDWKMNGVGFKQSLLILYRYPPKLSTLPLLPFGWPPMAQCHNLLNLDFSCSLMHFHLVQWGVLWQVFKYLWGTSLRMLKEHLRVHAPSMTMPRPQVIMPGWTTSSLWVGSHTSQGPSRMSCIWESMIHPSTGTLGSFSCPTYGRRSFSTPLASNLNRPFLISRCSLHMTHNLSWLRGAAGGSHFVSTPYNFG